MLKSLKRSFKLNRDKKRLKKILSRTNKLELLKTIWVLDRMWFDPNFQFPNGYEFPDDALPQDFSNPNTIYPWELETLVTEILRVKLNPGEKQGNARSWALIATIVNLLRSIENLEYVSRNQDSIFREISRIGYRQFRWQGGNWQGAEYIRWWSILREEGLQVAFERNTGVSVKKFMAVGIVWNNILNTSWVSQEIQNKDVTDISSEDVTAIVNRLSAPIAQLETDSRAVVVEAGSTAYRRGVLRATPIVKHTLSTGNVYFRPVEMLLKWRLSSGLYYDVIVDPEVQNGNMIGNSFEKYVCDLLAAKFSNWQVSGEQEYGTRRNRKKTPDVVVTDNNATQLVIECKAIKLPLGVQITIDDIPERERVINDLVKGVRQVCEFQTSLAAGIPDLDFVHSDNMINIVVTLDDWLFMGHDIKREIKERAILRLEEQGKQEAAQLVENVILCTSDELETLVTVFSTESVVETLRASLTEEHIDSALGAVMTQISDGRLDQPVNPLADRLDEFLSF